MERPERHCKVHGVPGGEIDQACILALQRLISAEEKRSNLTGKRYSISLLLARPTFHTSCHAVLPRLSRRWSRSHSPRQVLSKIDSVLVNWRGCRKLEGGMKWGRKICHLCASGLQLVVLLKHDGTNQ